MVAALHAGERGRPSLARLRSGLRLQRCGYKTKKPEKVPESGKTVTATVQQANSSGGLFYWPKYRQGALRVGPAGLRLERGLPDRLGADLAAEEDGFVHLEAHRPVGVGGARRVARGTHGGRLRLRGRRRLLPGHPRPRRRGALRQVLRPGRQERARDRPVPRQAPAAEVPQARRAGRRRAAQGGRPLLLREPRPLQAQAPGRALAGGERRLHGRRQKWSGFGATHSGSRRWRTSSSRSTASPAAAKTTRPS